MTKNKKLLTLLQEKLSYKNLSNQIGAKIVVYVYPQILFHVKIITKKRLKFIKWKEKLFEIFFNISWSKVNFWGPQKMPHSHFIRAFSLQM